MTAMLIKILYKDIKKDTVFSTKMLLLLLISASVIQVRCAKILGVFPIPSISHQVVYQPIWKELSLRGHQVTVTTPSPLNNPGLTNLSEIDLGFTYEYFRQNDITSHMAKDNYKVDGILWLFDMIEHITEEHFKKAANILNDPKTKFDLIIVETLHPLVYSLGCKFKVPIIGISSLGVLLQTHDAVGNPTHPIVAPDIFANIETFSTYEKICSVVHNIWFRIIYYWKILPRNDKIARKYWGDCPYLGDLERNVSLILVNTSPILHPVRPNVPNIIEMGQMHIRPKTSLPKVIIFFLTKLLLWKMFRIWKII